MATLGSPRRYYLAKRQGAAAGEMADLEAVWRSKQEAEPGTALPVDFYMLEQLEAHGYTTEEDLEGADACELTTLGFSTRQADAILTAFSQLP